MYWPRSTQDCLSARQQFLSATLHIAAFTIEGALNCLSSVGALLYHVCLEYPHAIFDSTSITFRVVHTPQAIIHPIPSQFFSLDFPNSFTIWFCFVLLGSLCLGNRYFCFLFLLVEHALDFVPSPLLWRLSLIFFLLRSS